MFEIVDVSPKLTLILRKILFFKAAWNVSAQFGSQKATFSFPTLLFTNCVTLDTL